MEEGRVAGGRGFIPHSDSLKQKIERQNCRSTRANAIARRWLVFDSYNSISTRSSSALCVFFRTARNKPRKVIAAEAAERRRILAQVYSLIVSWGGERKKSSVSIKTSTVQETKSLPSGAVTIPHGKYRTIAQVAEIWGVKKKNRFRMAEKWAVEWPRSPRFGENRRGERP